MTGDSPYIAQMLECIEKIKEFTADVSQDKFARDDMRQSAVLMQLLLTGELSKRISSDTKSEIAIPWPQIAGMRNRVAHEYYEIDLENVWKIISEDLAATETPLAAYLAAHPLPPDPSSGQV